MRETANKFVLFNIKDKTFYAEDGDCVETIGEAYKFNSKNESERVRNNVLDSPSDFETLSIYIVYQTKTNLQDMFE